jgi:peptidoglycan/xylan/chitin deacetylase (PgdA/CDA1 family)
MVYEWGMASGTDRSESTHRAILVRQHHLGAFDDPAPRPAFPSDPVLHWGRWGFLPVSSLMRVQTDAPVACVTYDDGPDPEQTPAILDVLAERGVCATFFVLSDRAETYPAIISRMVAEGHEVALHGIDHSRLTDISAWEAVRRVREAKLRVEDVSGCPVRFYRPTYGAVGISTLAASRVLGMEIMIWSAWALDWLDAPVAEVADRAVKALHPGAILLLHDTTDDPAAAEAGTLPTFSRAEVIRRILAGADAAGFHILPARELVRRYPAVRSVTVQRPRPHLPFR